MPAFLATAVSRPPVPGSLLSWLGLVLGAAGGLVAVEEGGDLEVFGAGCCFFGRDDVGEVGDHDFGVGDPDPVGARGQLVVAGGEAGGVEGDVEFAVLADQVPGFGGKERGGAGPEGA